MALRIRLYNCREHAFCDGGLLAVGGQRDGEVKVSGRVLLTAYDDASALVEMQLRADQVNELCELLKIRSDSWIGGVSALRPSGAERRPRADTPRPSSPSEGEVIEGVRRYLESLSMPDRLLAWHRLGRLMLKLAPSEPPGVPQPVRGTRQQTYTYFVRNPATGLVKIGSSNDPSSRLLSLQIGAGCLLELLGVILADVRLERELHSYFQSIRRFGEWFEASSELLAYIEKYASEEGA